MRATNPDEAVELRSKTSGDPTHRLGSLAEEESKEPDLPEREVAGGDRRDVARHEVESGEHGLGGHGQRLVPGDWFRHTWTVHVDVKCCNLVGLAGRGPRL